MKNNNKAVPAWDLPTRLFHWALVALIISAYLTYEFGDALMEWHMLNGYAILTLAIYRLLWGVFGSNTARFTNFIQGPGAIIRYLKSARTNSPEKHLGHNPLGALMVILLLALILLQGSMGLFTSDDIMVEGPLVHIASSDWITTAGSIHRIGFWVITSFAVLHIIAALFYTFVKKDNLIKAMVTGNKGSEHVPQGEFLKKTNPLFALVLLGVSAGLVWLILNFSKF